MTTTTQIQEAASKGFKKFAQFKFGQNAAILVFHNYSTSEFRKNVADFLPSELICNISSPTENPNLESIFSGEERRLNNTYSLFV